MNLEGNFEKWELMKRVSWLMQGFKPLSRMLIHKVRRYFITKRYMTKGGLLLTHILYSITWEDKSNLSFSNN